VLKVQQSPTKCLVQMILDVSYMIILSFYSVIFWRQIWKTPYTC